MILTTKGELDKAVAEYVMGLTYFGFNFDYGQMFKTSMQDTCFPLSPATDPRDTLKAIKAINDKGYRVQTHQDWHGQWICWVYRGPKYICVGEWNDEWTIATCIGLLEYADIDCEWRPE